MFGKQLTYSDLDIQDDEVFRQMGYGDARPDEQTLAELRQLQRHLEQVLRPRFGFEVIDDGRLDTADKTLTLEGTTFSVGRIIAAQLRGSCAYAVFVATAGAEFQQLQERLAAEGDMVKVFIADSLGSVIAEKTADIMERWLQVYVNSRGWLHTNRFSPGYCGWHVSQQQLLFALFDQPEPCGVTLTDSSLMLPIKSVSGVIGLGPSVRKLEYTCGLCDYAKCYKRRKRPQK